MDTGQHAKRVAKNWFPNTSMNGCDDLDMRSLLNLDFIWDVWLKQMSQMHQRSMASSTKASIEYKLSTDAHCTHTHTLIGHFIEVTRRQFNKYYAMTWLNPFTVAPRNGISSHASCAHFHTKRGLWQKKHVSCACAFISFSSSQSGRLFKMSSKKLEKFVCKAHE